MKARDEPNGPMEDEEDIPILFGRVLCEYLIKEGVILKNWN